ncbi:MAG: tetratricopeptide repeat protein [Syntrophales bacterium]
MSDILRRKSNYLIVAILAILILSIYWQVGKYPFIAFDDDVYVYENPHVRRGLTLEGIAWSFTTFHGSNWHPLTWISHMTDVELFGMDAGWHHRMSVLFHLLNTVLLYFVMWQMTGGVWRSAFVAALFGVHPLHVESVAWIAERKDLLSTLFWILTMGVYLRYARRPSLGRYLPVAIFFALGLMCKPMVVTLPFVLLLMDWWPLRRIVSQIPQNSESAPYSLSTVSGLVLEKVPLLGLSAISCFVTFLAQSWEGAVQSFDYIPFGMRISNGLVSYVSYLCKMVWPSSLTVFYPHPATAQFGLPGWEIVGAALLIVAFSLFAMRQRQCWPSLTMGWLWYLGTLVPVIGLVQVGNQCMADRYTYTTLIGIFIAVAWAPPSLFLRGRFRQLLFGILGGMVIVALSTVAWHQTSYWRDDVALFSRSLAVTKNNWLAWNNLGVAYDKLNRSQWAMTCYREAIRIKPDYADAWNNIGAVYIKSGQPEQAIVYFREALKANPYYTNALNNLAAVYYELGQSEQAIMYYSKALQIKPDYAEAWYNLGLAYVQYGQLDRAVSCFREALRIKPDFKEALQKLSVTENPGKRH